VEFPQPTDHEIERMQELAREFGRKLWAQRCIEYKAENPHFSDKDIGEIVDGKIGPYDFEAWCEYATQNFHSFGGLKPVTVAVFIAVLLLSGCAGVQRSLKAWDDVGCLKPSTLYQDACRVVVVKEK